MLTNHIPRYSETESESSVELFSKTPLAGADIPIDENDFRAAKNVWLLPL